MTSVQMRGIVAEYRSFFEKQGIGKSKFPLDWYVRPEFDKLTLEHCHQMLDEIDKMLDGLDRYLDGSGMTPSEAGNSERLRIWEGKAERWICFVQGVLWCHGFYTIAQMADHNRPKASAK